jgi:hypothetical protein
MRKFFLACPYGHADQAVVEMRFDLCNTVSARIIQAGDAVFSQVSMSHPINAKLAGMDKPTVGKLWEPIDRMFMEAMNELVVIDAPGWRESSGVAREIEFFRDRGRPVHIWSEMAGDYPLCQVGE